MNHYDKLTVKALRIAGVFLSAIVLSGCASIVSKSNYPVAINSNPSGVDFYVTNFSGARWKISTPRKCTQFASKVD